MDWENQLNILLKIIIAFVLGGIIGLERDLAGKPAGIRTHMLISGAAAFLIGTGNAFLAHFNINTPNEVIRPDPFRIMGAIVTGLSFIGAGSIIRSNSTEKVEGLTTAASLLFAAAIGMGVALEQIYLAIGSTILVVFINRVIIYFEIWIKDRIGKNPRKKN